MAMMKRSVDNMYRLFVGLALRRPIGMLVATALGALLSLLLSATLLEFHTDRLDLVSSGNRYKQLDQAFSREFEDPPERVIVVIRSPKAETAKAFATTLAERWENDPSIEKVLYRIKWDALRGKALLYLPQDELTALQQKLQQYQGLLDEFAVLPTLDNLFALINREMTQALVSHVFTDFLVDDRPEGASFDLSLLRSLLRQLNQRLDHSAPY